ncbi:MAG: ammonium transporter, partial [Actinomycetota bacterium]|nr:ammonium transporter [Actinomycetota bacterium]
MNAVAIDTVWVVVAGCLVLLMQAGFAALEMGLSRMKNAGAVAAKVIVNFALALVVFWAIGYAIAFGDGSGFAGATAWFIDIGNSQGVAALSYSGIDETTKFFFQAMFAAVALAIVWGTTLDRARFVAYLPFAILFVGLIYP